MKRKLILPVLLLIASCASAQKLQIEKTTVNVGRTGYRQPITAVFDCVNKGGRKVRIKSIQPDCSCTTVDYPKGELGEKFQIRMTYDARQLGHFNKQAAVVSSALPAPIYLCMTGNVLEDYVDYSGQYPVKMGDLWLDKADLEFDDINRGDLQVQELHVYNNSSKTCQPYLMHLPSYLTAVTTPERLAPGKGGTITVTLNSTMLHGYGLTQNSVYMAANLGDKVRHDHEIGVSAVLLPSFDGVADLQHAPQLQLSEEAVDIHFDGKSKKKAVIDITNSGHSTLDITSLQLFTIGLKVSLNKRKLQPGETAKLKITAIRDDFKRARTRPRILMITNDPTRPKVIITINER